VHGGYHLAIWLFANLCQLLNYQYSKGAKIHNGQENERGQVNGMDIDYK